MSRLPHSERAVLDVNKIEDYCLDPMHLHGRHKARVFRSALGLIRSDAAWLREALLQGVRDNEAVELVSDIFGVRWRVDLPVRRHDRHAVIRTVWIVRTGDDAPRFVTCWVL